MYGDQHIMNTMTMMNVIFIVFTLARGIIPRELALRIFAGAVYPLGRKPDPFTQIVRTMIT